MLRRFVQKCSRWIDGGAKRKASRRHRAPLDSYIEELESRTTPTVTFADLPYTDPFPAPAQLGQASQDPASILYSESFNDQTPTGGVLGAADHAWYGQGVITRPLPAGLSNGLSVMSFEMWLKVPVGSNVGWSKFLDLPGFYGYTNF